MKSYILSALFASSLLPITGFAITDGTETFSVADTSLLGSTLVGAGGITVSNVQGWDFTIFSAAGITDTSVDIWDGAVASGNGVAFYETNAADDVHFNALRITPTDASSFDLNSIGLNLQIWNGSAVVNNQLVTLSGLDENGDIIAGATLSLSVNDGLLVSFITSDIPQFNQVSGVLITPTSNEYVISYGFVDDISVSNVTAVPEPATWSAMAGAFVLGFALLRRRKA